MSEYSHLCFPPEQMTCKSKYDVRVDQDRTQVYDTGAGLPVSGRSRWVWKSHVGCEGRAWRIIHSSANLLGLYIHLIHACRTPARTDPPGVLIRTSSASRWALARARKTAASQISQRPRRCRSGTAIHRACTVEGEGRLQVQRSTLEDAIWELRRSESDWLSTLCVRGALSAPPPLPLPHSLLSLPHPQPPLLSSLSPPAHLPMRRWQTSTGGRKAQWRPRPAGCQGLRVL